MKGGESMARIWVTSDQHWGHKNIIKYSQRPFETVEEMNKAMVDNWNAVVLPTDIIYHLGDIGLFRNPEQAKDLISQLNGYKILVLGNHDRRSWDWEEIGFKQVSREPLTIGNYILSHKPLSQSEISGKYILNIHGHIHTYDSPYPEVQLNVSVEQTNYTPVLLYNERGQQYTDFELFEEVLYE